MVKSPKPTEFDWTQHVKGLLKAELKFHNMTYADLVLALHKIGIEESEVNLRNKVARGMFTAVFFFQCLSAIGVTKLELRR
jgi:Domain of unknown function (DUF6471)